MMPIARVLGGPHDVERTNNVKEKLIRELRTGFLETDRGLAMLAASNVADLILELVTGIQPPEPRSAPGGGHVPNAVVVGRPVLVFGTEVRYAHQSRAGRVVGYRVEHYEGELAAVYYRVDFDTALADEAWINADLLEVVPR